MTAAPPLSPAGRAHALAAMAEQELDVLVIGGGVTGAGCALDAVTRGLTVGLVEARDFAAGTSSRSTKLFHGGLRYLEQLNFPLVLEALKERSLVLNTLCPHLARPVPFIYPLERPVLDRAYVGLGIGVYDVMGAGRGVPGHHQHLGRKKALESFPSGRRSAIKGAIRFYEGQVDDARHTMMIARTAAQYGALCANSARVVGFLREDDRVVGARVRDLESGHEFDVRAQRGHQRRRGVDRRDPEDGRRSGAVPGPGVQGRAPGRAPQPDQLRHGHHHPHREEPAVHHPVGQPLDHRHHRHRLGAGPGPPGRQPDRHRLPARPRQLAAAGPAHPRGRGRGLRRAAPAAVG